MFQCLAGLMNKSRNNRKIIQKFSLKSHVKLRLERVVRRKFCLSFHSGAFVSLSQKNLFTVFKNNTNNLKKNLISYKIYSERQSTINPVL